MDQHNRTSRFTYRYGVIIFGASYGPGDPAEPLHVVMAETLSDVERILRNAQAGTPWRYDLMGDGSPMLHTPLYGNEGDGADVYRVNTYDNWGYLSQPMAAVLAFNHMSMGSPAYRFTFGPRGGLKRETW